MAEMKHTRTHPYHKWDSIPRPQRPLGCNCTAIGVGSH